MFKYFPANNKGNNENDQDDDHNTKTCHGTIPLAPACSWLLISS